MGNQMLYKHHAMMHKRQGPGVTVTDVASTVTAIDLVDDQITPAASATFLLPAGDTPDEAVASELSILFEESQDQTSLRPAPQYTTVTVAAPTFTPVPAPQKLAVPQQAQPQAQPQAPPPVQQQTSQLVASQPSSSQPVPLPVAPVTTQQAAQPSTITIPSSNYLPTTAVDNLQPESSIYTDLVLQQHNIHRDNHSALALAWNETLANYAEETAKTCVYAHSQ